MGRPLRLDFSRANQVQTEQAFHRSVAVGRDLVHMQGGFGGVQHRVVGTRHRVGAEIFSGKQVSGVERVTGVVPLGQNHLLVHRTCTASRSTARRNGEPLRLRLSHSSSVYARIEGAVPDVAASR